MMSKRLFIMHAWPAILFSTVLGNFALGISRPPAVRTVPVDSITEGSVQLWAEVTDDMGRPCYTWFDYREAGTLAWQATPLRWPARMGDVIEETVTGLKPGLSYQFRGRIRNYAGMGMGETHAFVTAGSEQSLTVTSSEGGQVQQPGEGYYTYPADAVQALEAVADHGYGFLNWAGSAVNSGRVIDPNAPFTRVTVDGNDTLTAQFSSIRDDPQWQWETLKTNGYPTGRHETSLVECGGKFYMIGGRESRQIDCFDPETQRWTKMGVTTPLIHHYQPVVWDNKIYMVGAMTGSYPKEPPMTRVQIYDPTLDTWTEGDEMPAQRLRGSAGTVVYHKKIYMVCGITLGHTSGTNNWFDEFDPATGVWTSLPDAPHIRDHFHAVVLDDKLYCIGGRNTSYRHLTNPNQSDFFGAVERWVDVYDFTSGTWSTLPKPLPVGSAAGGIATLSGLIFYFGGENASTALDRTQVLDPLTGDWHQLARLQQGRHGSQAVVYRDRIYISAGSPNRGGGRVTSTEVFSYVKAKPSSGRR